MSSSSAYNLIGAGGGNSGLTNGVNGNQVGVANPGLAALADNGGPTQTIALLAGSPAIDAGSTALANDPHGDPLTTDQRGLGFARTVNGTVDIGAYELSQVSTPPTVYIVDLTSDTGASTSANEGDLLYCVTQANANTNPEGSVIEFDSTVFNASTPQTIKLSSTLDLSETGGPEVIDGPGATIVTVSGNNAVEVFDAATGVTVTLSNLTVSGGYATDGGGIRNEHGSTLTLNDDIITKNSATYGAGIYNAGTLTLTSSVLSHDFADGSSGALGGGLYNSGAAVSITDSTLTGNFASGFGGGIYTNAGLLTLVASTVGTTDSDNSAGENGAGLYVFIHGSASVADSTFTNNLAVDFGGGIYNNGTLTVTNTTLADNQGGGIGNAGTLTLSNSTLSGNSSSGNGGGIWNDGPATVTNTTISGNTASGDGGGIDDSVPMTLVNSTIAYNNTGSSRGGLAIFNCTVTLYNTIVALNTDGTGATAEPDDNHRPARLAAHPERYRRHRCLRAPNFDHQQSRAHSELGFSRPGRRRPAGPPDRDPHRIWAREHVVRPLELDRAGDDPPVVWRVGGDCSPERPRVDRSRHTYGGESRARRGNSRRPVPG